MGPGRGYTGAMASRGIQQIESLRKYRDLPRPDLGLDGPLASLQKELSVRVRVGGVLEEAWEELLPEGLRQRTSPVGIRRGVLTVRVGDSGADYLLSAWLRGGGMAALRKRVRAPIQRVKTVG